MSQYFVHNGYCGWAYGTPGDPLLVLPEDAAKLMRAANLSADQVALILPPAQYAETGGSLFEATGGNRFLFFGNCEGCADVKPHKVTAPLVINWPAI